MQKFKNTLFKLIGLSFGVVVFLKLFGGTHSKTLTNDVVNTTKTESVEARDARQLEEACNLQNENDIKKKARELLYVVTNTTRETANIYYMSKDSYIDGRKDTSEIRKKYFVFGIDYLDDHGNAAAADYCLLVKKDAPEVYMCYPGEEIKKYNSDESSSNSSINNDKKSRSHDSNVNSTPKDVVETMITALITNDMDLFLRCSNPEDLEEYSRKYKVSIDKVIEHTQKAMFNKFQVNVQQYNMKTSDFSISQPDNYKERSKAYVQVSYLGNVKSIDRQFEIPVYRAYNGKWYYRQD